MKKSTLLAFLVIGIMGTLWHFLYEWSNNNTIIGLIAPVNESTWEHLKLLFFPTVIYRFFEYIFTKNKPKNYIPATLLSLIAGMLSTVIIFYTYSGIVGYNISIIDIWIFFVSLIILLIVHSSITRRDILTSKKAQIISIILLIILVALFCIWSIYPPSIGIFIPPAEA